MFRDAEINDHTRRCDAPVLGPCRLTIQIQITQLISCYVSRKTWYSLDMIMMTSIWKMIMTFSSEQWTWTEVDKTNKTQLCTGASVSVISWITLMMLKQTAFLV